MANNSASTYHGDSVAILDVFRVCECIAILLQGMGTNQLNKYDGLEHSFPLETSPLQQLASRSVDDQL